MRIHDSTYHMVSSNPFTHQKQTSQQDKDAGHWLDISEGTRCGLEGRSMYRTQVVWLEVDALYAFEGGGYGGDWAS